MDLDLNLAEMTELGNRLPHSFGWSGPFVRVKDFQISEARHWNTVVGFTKELSPVFISLQDFIDSKNIDDWRNKCRRVREYYGAGRP